MLLALPTKIQKPIKKVCIMKLINTELTIELAIKAKAEGIKQFIFMSSMIVYGAISKLGEKK